MSCTDLWDLQCDCMMCCAGTSDSPPVPPAAPPLDPSCPNLCGENGKTCADFLDVLSCFELQAIGCGACANCCTESTMPRTPPSLPPGQQEVVGSMVLGGTVDDFDEEAFKAQLAAKLSDECSCTVLASDIQLSVAAVSDEADDRRQRRLQGGITVDFVIQASAEAASAAEATMQDEDALGDVLTDAAQNPTPGFTAKGGGMAAMTVSSTAVTFSPPNPPALPPPTCGPGTYEAVVAGVMSCENCADGTYADAPETTACTECPAGYYCPPALPWGAVKPVPCPAGTYSGGTMNTVEADCLDVVAGEYAPLGSTAALACPTAGATFSCPGRAADAQATLNSPAGSQPRQGAAQGLLAAGLEASCPPGKKLIGAESCEPCPKGSYCRGGVEFGCPLGTWQPATSMYHVDNCTACPMPGTDCQARSETVRVRAGYYLESASAVRGFACPGKDSCPGGDNAFNISGCRAGHTGLLCGECISGYYRGRWECLSCAGIAEGGGFFSTPELLFPILALLVTLAVVLYLYPPFTGCFKKTSENSHGFVARISRQLPQIIAVFGGLVKIMLQYCQCLGAIRRFNQIGWPSSFDQLMQKFDEVNLELFSTVPAECIVGRRLGIYIETLATLLIPIIMLVWLLAIVATMNYFRLRCGFVRVGHAAALAEERQSAAEASTAMSLISSRFSRSATREPSRSTTHREHPGQGDEEDEEGSFFQQYRRLLRREIHQPKVYKLMCWVMIFCYPSLARKSVSIFDCIEAGEDDSGKAIYLLFVDPAERCFTPEYTSWAIFIGVLGIGVYCIGFPLATFIAARRYQKSNKEDRSQYERISVLVSVYEPRYVFFEAISLLHKFCLTGLVFLFTRTPRLQLWFGIVVGLLVFVVYMFTLPFKSDTCDWVQNAVLLSLLLAYISAFLFILDGSDETENNRGPVLGGVLVGATCLCFVVLLGFATFNIISEKHRANQSQLRYRYDGSAAKPRRPNTKHYKTIAGQRTQFHLFLSHVWRTGQDQMRVVKQRMLEVMPGLDIFLDVDIAGLEIGDLEQYIDATDTVLVFCSQGYFQSANCMRELKAAVEKEKQIIPMMEPDKNKGGLTVNEVRGQLELKSFSLTSKTVARDIATNELVELRNKCAGGSGRSSTFGLAPVTLVKWLVEDDQVVESGTVLCHVEWAEAQHLNSPTLTLAIESSFSGTIVSRRAATPENPVEVPIGKWTGESHLLEWHDPEGTKLFEALFANEPVEWNRFGAFQDVTLRLVASKLLPLKAEGGRGSRTTVVRSSTKRETALQEARGRQATKGTRWGASPASKTSEVPPMEAGSAEEAEAMVVEALDAMEHKRWRWQQNSADEEAERLYIQNELWWQLRDLVLPPPRKGAEGKRKRFHLFLSYHNAGVKELIAEMNSYLKIGGKRSRGKIKFTTSIDQLEQCECMLLYLNEDTWSSGLESERLGVDVATAMQQCVPVLLAHEMPDPNDVLADANARRASTVLNPRQMMALSSQPSTGMLDQILRKPCEFYTFFDLTPDALLQSGIYDVVAVALKGGAWRQTSRAMMVEKLANFRLHSTQPTQRQLKMLQAHIGEVQYSVPEPAQLPPPEMAARAPLAPAPAPSAGPSDIALAIDSVSTGKGDALATSTDTFGSPMRDLSDRVGKGLMGFLTPASDEGTKEGDDGLAA